MIPWLGFSANLALNFLVGHMIWSFAPEPGWVPPPWAVGAGGAVALLVHQLAPSTWLGVAIDVAALALAGVAVVHWSRRAAWGRAHGLALAAAALLTRGGLSFATQPLDNPAPEVRYSVNATLTLGALLLLAWAFYRLRRVT